MDALPKEILITIFQNLNVSTLSKMEQLNKYFYTLIRSMYTFKCGDIQISTPINQINELFTNPTFTELFEKIIQLKKFLHQTHEQYDRHNPKIIFQNLNLNCKIKPEYIKKIEAHIKLFMAKFNVYLNMLYKDLYILQNRQHMHPKNVEKRLIRVNKTLNQLTKFYDESYPKLVADINYQTELFFITKYNGNVHYKVTVTPNEIIIRKIFGGHTERINYECIYIPDHGAVRNKKFNMYELGKYIGRSLLIKQKDDNYVHVCDEIEKLTIDGGVKSYYGYIYRSDCILPFIVKDDGSMVSLIDWINIDKIHDLVEFVL